MLTLLAVFALASLLLPFLVAWIGPRAFAVAALVPAAAFVHTAMLTPQVLLGSAEDPAVLPREAVEWIPPLGLSLSFRLDELSWLLALIVTGVGALVLLYCRWYFRDSTEGLGQFAAVLLAFAGAMYGLVTTDDLVLLVMFWEVTSILSYLLIGHYHRRGASRRAALQALLVTTLGGLAMFIGVVFLAVDAGTSSISRILEIAPTGPLVDAAIVLLLVGALSKSAIFPFHFWLPGAMAAPTPVSAYLHAAAMVKAGIYLIARFAPVFALSGPWRPITISLGVFTMLLGGVQALRETDLKRILAFGTVSQLGFFTIVLGYGTSDAMLAGLALVISHALFKSSLFLIVGVIDRQLSTRDVTEISGVGRQAPLLATAGFLAVGSMMGIPPTIGFVAKESTLAALFDESLRGSPWGIVALVGVILGSILTAAYGARFLWGAFWRKKDAAGAYMPDTEWPSPPFGFLVSPVVLAAGTLVLGPLASAVTVALYGYADDAKAPGYDGAPLDPGYLALWHGLAPALFLSLGAVLLGLALFPLSRRWGWDRARRLLPFTAQDAYYAVMRSIDRLSVVTTSLTQRGSLPVYVGTIFVVVIAGETAALIAGGPVNAQLSAWHTPVQLVVAPIMIAAGLLAIRAKKRYTGVVLVSVTGLGMVVLFGTSGAPDLALTQILVETVTLVTFALVLRRLPARMGEHNASVGRVPRAILGVAAGVMMALVAIVATGSRIAEPISDAFPQLAYELGHGKNVVNVALVDLRGWDTMGELSVLVLAATGVASLVFVTHRADRLSATRALPEGPRQSRRRPLVETTEGVRVQTAGDTAPRAWLVGGGNVRPENRSILLEVIVRILFHTIIVVSIYLLFAGHNAPGGGFAGGLVAGMALVMRYIAGGRWELGAAAPTDAGRLLGGGLILAVGAAVVPLLFGLAPLSSAVWEAEIPVIGHLEFVSSTIFDIGVYLVVIGLVLDVLRSLGAEVDRQTLEMRARGVDI
ncbi:Na+/H+ antiporter subunit A [Microbacterium azadirachtae]|uniref:Na+/H+ antiporter subunit A n=1 Tax=Microbacterium azadirachtae TaxID=582680 RepID=UPI000882D8A1|nr:Na+/H+ antiporter subunit A [Microbacterium azadirachtae]SDL65731.1 multisubunit sodium/proton antiporter, MrpA subunit /multisubunit sodium/proton antiporter, MrpB subunit [Microbacterium azadirachtae]SEF95098.1 multisubunit sodium/proton antiporter, MrpA subunit /multisubunit sodium/proton antiporter, MrpB subunit [Microbacterium azadirachtae]SEF97632.1 multisubunit sodium/proton antiporter, MrpA subunit /multisubunit sodium/proton antiporter, MrpB subunit [Microbacterium azadirachtae]